MQSKAEKQYQPFMAIPMRNAWRVTAFTLLCFCCMTLTSMPLSAQQTFRKYSLTAGQVIPVNGSRYEGFTPTIGVEVSHCWQMDDQRFWTQFWHRPLMGLHLGYAHLQNGLVGDRFEVGGMLQTPIWRGLAWSSCVGLSFYTNPHKRSHNDENIFIGSYINALIMTGFVYDFRLVNDNAVSLGAQIVHSSNGYMYKPNHGMNYVQLSLGYQLAHGSRTDTNAADRRRLSYAEDFHFEPSMRPFLALSPSFVMSRYDPDDLYKYYFAYTLQGGVIAHAHPCFSYGCDMDMMYNYANRSMAHRGDPKVNFGMAAFGEAHWGVWTLRMGAGHYMDYYWQAWEQWYMRIGVYANIFSRSRIGATMKLHYDHIDYVEWTYMIEI